MKSKLFLIHIALFLFSNVIEAQQPEISEMEVLASHLISNSSPYYSQEIAERILEEDKENYSFKEYYQAGIIALNCEEKYRRDLGSLAVQGMEPYIISAMKTFQDADINQRKELVLSWLDYYCSAVCAFFSFQDDFQQLDFYQLVMYFHQYIYSNRYNLFDKNETKDIFSIMKIIVADCFYCVVSDNYGILFNTYVDEFVDLSQTLPSNCIFLVYNEFKNFDSFVSRNELDAFLHSLPRSLEMGFYEDPYVENKANYYIRLKELELLSMGSSIRFSDNNRYFHCKFPSIELKDIGWKDIQKSLNANEFALLLRDGNNNGNGVKGVLITPFASKPIDFVCPDASCLIDELSKKYSKIDRLFVCPNKEFQDFDIAYCDDRVCLKYSLMNINTEKEVVYGNKEICVFADIDYGFGKNGLKRIEEITTDKTLVSELKQTFGDKMYLLSGNNVKKVNFLNTTNHFGIIHLSTHGDIITIDKTPHDRTELYSSLLGSTNMNGFVLALSNYNDNDENSITADEIRRMDFSGVDLVFLDACNTINAGTSFAGTCSLAKAFYIGGATKVIGYLEKINPYIALDFALSFYNELTISEEGSYHDAFYKAKKQTIEKYRNTLKKDSLNRPILNVVLWE